MSDIPDILRGRLEQIAHAHIRARLLELKDNPQAMLAYVDHLLLDTRDGERRGFDINTATALLAIKFDLSTGKVGQGSGTGSVGDRPEFQIANASPTNSYSTVPLPKNW